MPRPPARRCWSSCWRPIAGGIAALRSGRSRTGIVVGTIGSLVAWFVWAYMVWLVGTRFLPEPATQADVGQVVRTTGFSAAPGTADRPGDHPGARRLVGVVTNLWMLVAMVIAVRQALDFQQHGARRARRRARIRRLRGGVRADRRRLRGRLPGLLEAVHPAAAPG